MPLEYDLRKTDLALKPNRFLLNSARVPDGSHKSHKWLGGETPFCGMGLPVHMEMGVQVSEANLSGKKKSSNLAFQPWVGIAAKTLPIKS